MPTQQRQAHLALATRLAAAALTVTVLCLAGRAAPAAANEAEPFAFSAFTSGAETEPLGITQFTLQPTETSTGDKTLNEPYFFNQAGGHPVGLTSTVDFATGDPKDVIIDLPAGLLANPQAVPRCSALAEHCPTDTQVGMFGLHFSGGEHELEVLGAIVNMTPYPGVPAELGFEVPFLGRVLLTGRIVRRPQGYSFAIIGSGLPVLKSGAPTLRLSSMETTLWGVPAAAVHNPQRGLSCFGIGLATNCQETGGASSGEEPVPFLTMPGTCSGEPPTTLAWADSWQEPGQYAQAQSVLPQMAYCERSPFSPEVTVRPETTRPEAPDGINISIRVPQYDGTIAAAPALRDATVTLPAGMSINPAVADGLEGCNATGPTGINIPTGLNPSGEALKPGEVGPGEAIPGNGNGPEEPLLAPGHCPAASVVGTAEATTPLLAHPIEGSVYIASPGCGGPSQGACNEQDAVDGNLYRLYVQLGAGPNIRQNQGLILKLAATVQANPATGQLTVRLAESPQLPISELSLHLFGGDRGLLANPTACGPATTTSELEPWSAPYTPDAAPSSYFNVEGCTSPEPFSPAFLAGSINTTAGAFSPFTLTITRKSGEATLAGLQVHTPAGLSAMLASVPLCSESRASTGECPEASRVGGSEVAAGAGSHPLYMPGNVYLTRPYAGAPFGLAIVTDADAGPLDLGRLVIRARIDINPQTAALTITSDSLPQIVLGVPLRVQRLSLVLDRPHFIINPTNCDEQQITATITGALAATADRSSRYALADCKGLAFKPRIVASTAARTSLANGASLDIKLLFPKEEQGAQANLARIKLALPSQLPTRLSSLQGSCQENVFDGDPAACPATSIVGIARARTPLLPSELEGPVYLLSHGHNLLPSPIVVLQDDGVAFHLPGSTTIAKSGISSVAFNATPDMPLSSLELYLPTGPHSLLGASKSLCAPGKIAIVKRKLTVRMHHRPVRRTLRLRERLPATLPLPTELAAHNGTIIHQTTQITVTGCTPNQLRGH